MRTFLFVLFLHLAKSLQSPPLLPRQLLRTLVVLLLHAIVIAHRQRRRPLTGTLRGLLLAHPVRGGPSLSVVDKARRGQDLAASISSKTASFAASFKTFFCVSVWCHVRAGRALISSLCTIMFSALST
jgi:hypothetical protein